MQTRNSSYFTIPLPPSSSCLFSVFIWIVFKKKKVLRSLDIQTRKKKNFLAEKAKIETSVNLKNKNKKYLYCSFFKGDEKDEEQQELLTKVRGIVENSLKPLQP